MDRRRFIAVTGSAALAGRSGATGAATRIDSVRGGGRPNFELASVDAPEEVGIDEEFSFGVTIANTGGGDGRFVSPVTARAAGEEMGWAGLIDLEVPAGGDATYANESAYFPYVSKVTYRIPTLDEEFGVRVGPATLAFGDPWVTPESILLTVRDVELQSSYEYRNREERADPGFQWAFARIAARNVADERTFLPRSSDFAVVAGARQFDEVFVPREAGAYESGEVDPGITREGWVAYELPAEIERSELVVSYADDDFTGEWIGRWRADERAERTDADR